MHSPRIVIVPQRLAQPVPHLAWNYRRRNDLRMRMLQARPRIRPMVLKNGYVIDAMIAAQRVKTFLKHS